MTEQVKQAGRIAKRGKEKMSTKQRYEAAKQYVDQQLDTMKKFGAAPKKMSQEEYRSLIDEVAGKLPQGTTTQKA
jgi:hypothetical protein